MNLQFTPRQIVSMLVALENLTFQEFSQFYPQAAESYVEEKWAVLKKNSARYLMYLDDGNLERMFILLASKLSKADGQ